ncbi:J domain-containing protein [Achromobacter marplatensis]|uniref:J domain-containing protein n=1 Tax=Achromobacter marplatensis TaxID=470868 RepID=UPI000277F84A|nr:J domain-containing protein [Achromobacter marplatensis]EJO33349.1 Heat shock protein DnaJ-like protein [Achromobacter marplatensis]
MKTHYDILKVSRAAPPEVIRAAYKALAQKHHPDRRDGNPAEEEIMSRINAAYEILRSEEKKARYDRELDRQAGERAEAEARSRAEMHAQAEAAANARARENAAEMQREGAGTGFGNDRPPSRDPRSVTRKLPTRVNGLDRIFIGVFLLASVAVMLPIHDSWHRGVSGGQGGQQQAQAAPATPSSRVGPKPISQTSEKPAVPQTSRINTPISSAPSGKPWPNAAGYLEEFSPSDFGGSIVTVDNTTSRTPLFFKLVNALRSGSDASRHVYVPAGQSFTIYNVAPGSYWLVFRDLGTGQHYQSESFRLQEMPSPQDPNRLQFSTVSYKATPKAGGYADARPISVAEFGR